LYYSFYTKKSDCELPGETMESVGEKLRQHRVEKGLTLGDVSASTRISLKNLQAIESDDVSQISSAFFYKSFVRQFAQRLGLDYSELAAAVQSCVSTIPEPAMPGQLHASLPNVPPLQPVRARNFRWFFSFVALVSVLAGCSGLYGMWETSRYNLQASMSSFINSFSGNSKNRTQGTVETGARASSAQPVGVPRKPAAATLTTTPITPTPDRKSVLSDGPAEPVAVANPNAETDSGFRVEVAAIEPTWLSITADDKEVYSGVLEAAETKELEGHDSARIRTGNAGGVNVLFNGKTIGSLGPRGQVRTVLFTKDNYEIVEPSAHIALTSFSPSGE
jgi:cytoskeleton protein RodZ